MFPSRIHCCCFQVSAMTSHWLLVIKAALFHTAKCQGALHCCSHLCYSSYSSCPLLFVLQRHCCQSFVKAHFQSLMPPSPSFFPAQLSWANGDGGSVGEGLYISSFPACLPPGSEKEMIGSLFLLPSYAEQQRVILPLHTHCSRGGNVLG